MPMQNTYNYKGILNLINRYILFNITLENGNAEKF